MSLLLSVRYCRVITCLPSALMTKFVVNLIVGLTTAIPDVININWLASTSCCNRAVHEPCTRIVIYRQKYWQQHTCKD
jgi:hypothetical protein